MTKWEYCECKTDQPMIADELNTLGAVGWEMCGVVFFDDSADGFIYYFKRAMAEQVVVIGQSVN
jgi:hypothetical protein